MAKVDLEQLLHSLEVVSFHLSEIEVFVNTRDGRIVWRGEACEDEIPEDIDDASVWTPMPTKHDLDLSQHLVHRFIAAHAPGLRAEVEAIFHRRGAWGRYKDLLHDRGLVDRWHAFEEAESRAALVQWCAEMGLEPSET